MISREDGWEPGPAPDDAWRPDRSATATIPGMSAQHTSPHKSVLVPSARRGLRKLRREARGLYWRLREVDDVELHGVRLTLDDWWATPELRQYIYSGDYEAPEYRVLVNSLRPDDRYLELGAGIGFLTTCACHRVGADKVFAYEANPQLVPVVERTAARNGFHPTVVNAVLGGSGGGQVPFYVDKEFWASSLAEIPDARRVMVPMLSFERELERIRPTYLMVDIEGGEVELLGAARLPSQVRAVCMETHPGQVGPAATQGLLNKLVGEGFILDLELSRSGVAFLSR